MKLIKQTISEKLSPALKAYRPARAEVEQFARDLEGYLDHIDSKETEENLKTHLMGLLKPTYQPAHTIEQFGDIDFVIRTGGKGTSSAVLFEAKREINKADMIRQDDINRKALHELILYFFRERHAGNTDIRHVVICTEFEMFVFEASDFERTFYQDKALRRDFEAWTAGKKSDSTTEFFYKEIAAKYVAASEAELKVVHIDLRRYKAKLKDGADDKEFVKLFKLLSPHGLLAKELSNDSNSLNKAFYDELLHLIGLEERKDGAKRVIGRLEKTKRNPGSLLENAIGQIRDEDDFNDPIMIQTYGSSNDDREFNIALELCLTWINRLLFLKLLEAQIFKFHGQDSGYKFLSTSMVSDFGDLSDLFFKVLAYAPSERQPLIQAKYEKIPYLNSSLFEQTKLEKSFSIKALTNGLDISLFSRTVFRNASGQRSSGKKATLSYIFDFLDAYDFGTIGGGDVQEESKTIINAAVLGLIFEKINGYKEGAIFTPGYVTMYMARKVIEKTVLEAFQKKNPSWTLTDMEDLRNNISDDRSKSATLRQNAVIDNLKICDPAVGSGHFLVSCLNELIALKSRLGILADADGNRLSDYVVDVDNDELIVVNADTDEVFAYQVHGAKVPKRLQQVQQTLFHEKQKLIENCLFGVDINANSVRICQLRLWIELLKSAYYRDGQDAQLETLPNIDINIKCGNSLLSRFKLDQSLSDAFSKAKLTVTEYRQLVSDYKNTKDKAVKRDLQEKIDKAKTRFQEESMGRLTKELDATIAQLKADEAQADLFVLGEEQRADQDAKIDEIHKKIADLEAKRSKLLHNRTFLAALEWRFEFPEVLDEKGKYVGFDIIIANPPYMRVQEIEATQPAQREFYERDYRTAHGAYDLANLFFELAVRLAKPKGNNNIFIFPHKLFNSANGAPLREYLMNTRAMKHITHFGANQVFDSALTYTCIALFNAEPAETFRFKKFSLSEDHENELANEALYSDLFYDDVAIASGLYGGNQWIFFDDPTGFECFKKIFSSSVPLNEVLSVFVGIQTSRDTLYVVKKLGETAETYKIQVNPDNKADKPPVSPKVIEVEKDFFRPFLMGRDVHRFETLETDRLVFFPYLVSGRAELVDIDTLKSSYPLTYKYVADYSGVFEAREGGKARKAKEIYQYLRENNISRFEQTKLTAMEICSSHANVALNFSNIYHSTTVYSFVKHEDAGVSYETFSAILNSTVFWWFLKHTGDTLQGDARRMKTNYINPFPLPAAISEEDDLTISVLVAEIVKEKAGPARGHEIQRLEDAINASVYKLYDLNEQEIKVIEQAI
ncbi:DUF7149 domain-containing protein [Roseovarius arcticus]|uniref:type IIG restriction enzyme/methyltransferase n=1 Tax=Roseovarius arcticus TaxID=2547404 RepID=UPI0011104236|nr:Eco57I restriction-modification methylase domain-containing protein [Roseovarius arcticus]